MTLYISPLALLMVVACVILIALVIWLLGAALEEITDELP